MTVKMSLDPMVIKDAIIELLDYRKEIERKTEMLVEILTTEGAEIAQAAYGDWGVQATPMTEGTEGSITVSGDMPLIAEFGAGDDTLDPAALFEGSPSTPVYPGSYSESDDGSGEYAATGRWHFGGETYNSVFPRQGLHMAKQYIIDNSTEIAQEVFGSD